MVDVVGDVVGDVGDQLEWVQEDSGPFSDSLTIMTQDIAGFKVFWEGLDYANALFNTLDGAVDVNLDEVFHHVSNLGGKAIGGSEAFLKLRKIVVIQKSVDHTGGEELSSSDWDSNIFVKMGNCG